MSYSRRQLLELALRHDFPSFIQRSFQTVMPGEPYRPNWHIQVIAWYLEQCRRGHIRRLIITLPPRGLKSLIGSIAFPAFVLGHDPSRRLICVSYGMDLTTSLSRACRQILESPWYRQLFPSTRLVRASEAELTTSRGGHRLGTSVGGVLTGRGGTMVIIDDPLKADDALSVPARQAVIDWFRGTLLSRLDDKANDVIVLIMQRLHLDDLAGHLLGTGDWVHLNLPAIAEQRERFQLDHGRIVGREIGQALHPAREPLEVLEELRRGLGTFTFSAQYQQNPLPPDGNMLRWSWLGTYTTRPEWQPGDQIIQSWDTASKAEQIHDYSACLTFLRRGDRHYLLHVLRERLDYPTLKRRVRAHAEAWNADAVLIEDKGSGTQLIQDLRADGPLRPIGIVPEGDKVTRMSVQSAKLEAGTLLIPTSAPGLADFQREYLQFPRGRHDDQIDALSQYLAWQQRREMWNPEDVDYDDRETFARRWEREFGPPSPSPWDM